MPRRAPGLSATAAGTESDVSIMAFPARITLYVLVRRPAHTKHTMAPAIRDQPANRDPRLGLVLRNHAFPKILNDLVEMRNLPHGSLIVLRIDADVIRAALFERCS